ncbi:MAG: TrmB family transcriptional regulator [Planctomycetes bacterium]|nr:TrmB family transcriptional regulator [Planctomycetota bacterium]
MNREIWIQKLRAMGLSGYEAQVYLALLGETRAPASRVVRKSGVPQSKVYGALASLIDRGYAEQVLGDVKLYRGVPPHKAFENYRRHVQNSLTDHELAMSALAREAPETPSDDPGALGIRLVRPAQAPSVFHELCNSAHDELLMALRAPLVLPPDETADGRLVERGVKLRYLMETAHLRDPVHGPAIVRQAEKSDQFRFIAKVPMRFMVHDRRLVMIELVENDGTAMGLVIPNAGLAENLRVLFNTLWAQARTIAELPAEMREPVQG